MPSEPGNGCVIISKKTSAAPYRLHKSGLRSFQELCRHDLDDFHPGTHIFRHFQTVWGVLLRLHNSYQRRFSGLVQARNLTRVAARPHF